MLRECYHGHTNLNSAERMLSRSCEHMSLWQKPVTRSCTPVPCWQNTITTTETDMLLWKYTTSYSHRPISCFLRMKIHDRKLIHTTTTILRSVRMVLEVHTNLHVHHNGRPISCRHTYIMFSQNENTWQKTNPHYHNNIALCQNGTRGSHKPLCTSHWQTYIMLAYLYHAGRPISCCRMLLHTHTNVFIYHAVAGDIHFTLTEWHHLGYTLQ